MCAIRYGLRPVGEQRMLSALSCMKREDGEEEVRWVNGVLPILVAPV